MTDRDNTILLLKCATSGYSLQNDCILEVGLILVDAADLSVIDANSWVAIPKPGVTAPDFHHDLMEECWSSTKTLSQVEGAILAGPWTTCRAVCSRALDFHLKFIKAQMPLLAKALERKLQIELKGLEMLSGRTWEGSGAPKTYRAGDEVAEAYAELCAYGVVRRGR